MHADCWIFGCRMVQLVDSTSRSDLGVSIQKCHIIFPCIQSIIISIMIHCDSSNELYRMIHLRWFYDILCIYFCHQPKYPIELNDLSSTVLPKHILYLILSVSYLILSDLLINHLFIWQMPSVQRPWGQIWWPAARTPRGLASGCHWMNFWQISC